MHRLTIANAKGGTAKSTTAVNLACALAERKRSVLVVDLDGQASTTRLFGLNPEMESPTSSEVLLGNASIDEATVHVSEHVGVVPASRALENTSNALTGEVAREQRLNMALSAVTTAWDYVLIDTPPNMGNLTVNGIVAGGNVLVPVMMYDPEAAEGLAYVNYVINKLNGLGLSCGLFGIFQTAVAKREVVDRLSDSISDLGEVLPVQCPFLTETHKAAMQRKPLFWVEPDCRVSFAYRELAGLVVERFEQFEVSSAKQQSSVGVEHV